MIRYVKDQKIDVKPHLRGGKGNTVFRELLTEDQFCGHGRQLSILSLEPGESIGVHEHNGESETYFILEGSGLYYDNGTEAAVGVGDCSSGGSGESHGIDNTGDVRLSFVALIVYA